MSSVDERVVKMVFDNSQFESKINSTINSLNKLNKSTDEIAQNTGGLSALGKAFSEAEVLSEKAGLHVSDVWKKVANILETQVATKIVNVGKQVANAMTFEGVADGFREYELKMGSIQTIMAGTGESLATVNKYLDELNTYSDKTIYSFADMTNNIGKFTNAGVKLEDAVLAIKGIANEAAVSGANANEASRAMYNFSQALSAGYVKLIDWKSIENANMATKEFKETLLEVASSVGTVEKQSNGMYKVLTKNANGATMKEMVSGTKNFNDSLQQQWMTTEVLTKALKIYATDIRDLSDAEKEAFESELKGMGLSDEQIKNFEELGKKATDAASEIKTFTMLIDTLKEAIGSGWAMSWQLVIGDFEEAKALWTEVGSVLSKFIDDQSNARNEMLKNWKAWGGRADLIVSLRKAFELLSSVIKPISEAMKEVFPPLTAVRLKEITVGLRGVMNSLKLSEESIDNIKRTAKGFFSFFDIGLQLIKSFIKAILPAGSGIASLADSLLGTTANIGDFITNLDEMIKETKFFDQVFGNIGKVISPVFNALKSGISGILGLISSAFSKINSYFQAKNLGKPLESVTKNVSSGIDNINKKLSGLQKVFDWLVDKAKVAGKAVSNAFKQIGDSFSGFSGGGNGGILNLIAMLNSVLTGGILYKLFTGGSGLASITGIFDTFGETLEAFQKRIKADTLITIAKAVAILAGSIVIVAMVDSNKLAGATAAIGTMAIVLAGAISIMMKAIQSFSATDFKKSFKIFGKEIFGSDVTKMLQMKVTLEAVSKALIAMGAAVLLMAVGLKVVSSAAESGHLWDSWAAISLMLGELMLVAIALGKWGGKTKGATKGLIEMGAALVLIAEAVAIVGKVADAGNLVSSVIAVGLLLAELGAIVILTEKFGGFRLGSMLGLVSLAVSLNLVVLAVKQVSDALGSEGQHMWQALGYCALILVGLVGAAAVLSKFAGFAALGGAGAVLAAAALLIVVQAIKQISDELGKTDQHVWQALGVIAVALLELAVGLTAMVATIPGAAALLIASAALVVLGGALKILGSLSLGEIVKGLITMAGALTILAVGLTAMILALPGAAALVVAAAGLTILAGALKIFGSMSLGEIVKSLLELTVALTAIAAMATVLSLFSPFVLAFSVALVAFGAGLTVAGLGMTVFASGLTSLMAVLPLGVTALQLLATTLLNLIPVAVEALMNALGIILAKIPELAPQIGAAVEAIVLTILEVLVGLKLKIAETLLEMITSLLELFTEYVPVIAEAGANLMIAFMEAISKEIPRIADEGYKCAIALVDGIADAIEKNNGELIAAVDHLMNAVIQAITQWLVEFTPLGLLIPENVKEGIMDGEFNVKDAIESVLKNAIEAIKGFFSDFKDAADYLISGLIEGLKGTGVGKVVSAAAELGGKVVSGLKSKKGLDENSPSWAAWLAGLFFDQGLEKGITENADGAVDASETLGEDVTNAMVDSLESGGTEVKDTVSGITDDISNSLTIDSSGITNSFKEVAKGTDILTNAFDKNTKSIKSNEIRRAKQEEDYKKITENSKKSAEAIKKKAEATDKDTEATKKNSDAQDANATATGKSTKAAKNQIEVMDYGKDIVDAFVKNYGAMYKNLGETAPVDIATVAIKNLAESTYIASLKAKDATEENKKTKATIEEMVKAFTALKTKVYDSVKSMFEGDSFFQKFEVKTEKTMASILEGMHSNINAVTDWSNKLVVLGTKGIDQGLLKQLSELGPKGYEYVNAFVNASSEQIQEANTLFKQAGTLPDSVSNSVVASYAMAGLNAVQGFANGVDENSYMALQSGDNVGTTYLKGLEDRLEIDSPSRATYRDGRYLDEGLANGIHNYDFLPKRAAVDLCNGIKAIFDEHLAKDKFTSYGKNVAEGLAEGMGSQSAKDAVSRAAQALSELASKITVKYNEISSPSELYRRYGEYIARGLANGMNSGESYIRSSARHMSEAVETAIEMVETIAESDMELHPVISPVLDLSNVRSSASAISSLFPRRSIAMASAIRVGSSNGDYESESTTLPVSNGSFNFVQNNYSPKALSRYEIYRDTKNLVSTMKGVIAHA